MKHIFCLFTFITLTLCINANPVFHPIAASISQQKSDNPLPNAFFHGRIGGENDTYMAMPGMHNGYYEVQYMHRIVKFKSYNAKTGILFLKAYAYPSGEYLGKFRGVVSVGDDGLHVYKGVFTNTKGMTVDFDLHEVSSGK